MFSLTWSGAAWKRWSAASRRKAANDPRGFAARAQEQRLGAVRQDGLCPRLPAPGRAAVREKSWIFFEIFLPLLAVAAYVFIYRALQAPEEYVGFVVMGGAMTAFWMNILWSMSSQLYWEKEQGNLALYIMAPNSMMAVLLGMALGGLFMTLTRALVILILGSWIFSVDYAVSSYLATGARLHPDHGGAVWNGHDVGFGVPAAQPGGLAYLQPGAGAGLPGFRLLFPGQEPGFLGPPPGFDHPAHPGSGRCAPARFPLGAVFRVSACAGRSCDLVVLSVVFLVGARWLLAYMERLAIREGRLTESRR